MSKKAQVTIYTDGSCSPNPGQGGWAYLLRDGKHEKALNGYEEQTTNNRMELTAAIQALQALKAPCMVNLHTDSQYLQHGVTKWLPAWQKRNWKRKGGKLANVDLWKALDAELSKHDIKWHWVKGHAGHPDNERVDELAKQAIRAKKSTC